MGKQGIPHREGCQDHDAQQPSAPSQTANRIRHKASRLIAVLDLDVLSAVTAMPVPEVFARAFVVRLLLLLARAVTVILLDALLLVLCKDVVGILDDLQGLSSLPVP